jgi:hypothetical protein
MEIVSAIFSFVEFVIFFIMIIMIVIRLGDLCRYFKAKDPGVWEVAQREK